MSVFNVGCAPSNRDSHLLFRSAFDKSRGRAFLHDGDMFYSPNCSREVDVPLPLVDGDNPFFPKRKSNGRYDLWELDASAYKRPAWWTPQFGWAAFIEVEEKILDSSLFSELRPSTAPYSPKGKNGYTLPPWDSNNWLRLDKQVLRACHLLSVHYQVSSILPWDPWQFGYSELHPRYGALKVCLEKALKWFLVCMGRLSYLIAAGETRALQFCDRPSFKRLPWTEVLLQGGEDVGINRLWLDQLYGTTAVCFVAEVERAGAFVDLVDDLESFFRPDVAWFCQYHVPVWYRWGVREALLSKLDSLAPLPHQLQIATTFIVQTPSSPDCTQRSLCTKKMEEFFKVRALRVKRKLMTETREAQQTRLARAKQPPRVSAPMYVWRNNGHGEYE